MRQSVPGSKAVRIYVSYIQPSFKWLGKVRAVVRVIRSLQSAGATMRQGPEARRGQRRMGGLREIKPESTRWRRFAPSRRQSLRDGSDVLVSTLGGVVKST